MKQNNITIPKEELKHKAKYVELIDKNIYNQMLKIIRNKPTGQKDYSYKVTREKLRFNFLFNLNKTIVNYNLNTAYYLN